MKKTRILTGIACVILAVLALAIVPVSAQDEARFNAVMEQIVASYNSGNYEAIHAMFNEPAAATTTKEKTAAFFKGLADKLGRITKTSPPDVIDVMRASFVLYLERGIIDAQLILDSSDRIAGLVMKPRMPAAKVPDRQTSVLRLPFEGQWFTLWGGETATQNQHVVGHRSQRFACDFVVHGPDGKSYKNEGKKNEDFYAFGRKVLAPAAGTVVDIISGIRDNKPGQPNPYYLMGNAVIILHRPGEYSFIGHLKFGSIAVKRGDKVKAGQLIGLCGNSGAITEPQIHYSLMNSMSLSEATGIKTLFKRVRVTKNGSTKTVSDYLPVKGDLVKL